MQMIDKLKIFILILLQPAFLLLSIHEQFRTENGGNVGGTILVGLLIGCFLLSLTKKLNLRIESTSILGVVFLASPGIFYLLTLLNPIFNYGLFWLTFIFAYIVMGTILFIRSNPDIENKKEAYISAVVVVYLVLALMTYFINSNVLYSPDSYSYYDMSQHIFSNFGLVNSVRQYQIFTEYGISFPYLFPMMIWFVNTLTGFSIYSGTIINLFVTFMSFYFLIKISKKLTSSPYPGLIATAVMVFNPEYLTELMSARAVPLSVLCALLVINVVVHSQALGVIGHDESLTIASNQFMPKKCMRRDLFLMGLFAGAGMVIRFDFVAISGLLGVILVLIFTLKKNIFKTIPFYVLGLLVFTSPWLAYSIVQFQTLWVSDNGGTMSLIHVMNPQRFFHPDEVIPTFSTDRHAWMQNRVYILLHRFFDLIYMMTRPVMLIITSGATAMGIMSNIKGKQKKLSWRYKSFLICIFVIYIVKTLAIYLVGYGDMRYHSEAVIVVLLIILCHLYIKFSKPVIWSIFVGLTILFSLMNDFQPMINGMRYRLIVPFVDTERILPSEYLLELESLLMEDGEYQSGREVRLFDLVGLNTFALGAHTDILAFGGIANINEERLLYLFDNFIQPNYIYAFDEDGGYQYWLDVLSRYYLLTRMSNGNVFAVTPLHTLSEAGTTQASDLTDSHWYDGINQTDQVILLENTPENRELLENATALRSDTSITRIISVIHAGDYWLHILCDGHVDLDEFSYPNIITVLQE